MDRIVHRDIIRYFALGVVISALSGCATYREIASQSDGGRASVEDVVGQLEEGAAIRVEMSSGQRYFGNFLRVEGQYLTLDGLGNYGDTDLVLDMRELYSIERRNESGGQIETGWFVVLGVVAVTAFLLSDWGLN